MTPTTTHPVDELIEASRAFLEMATRLSLDATDRYQRLLKATHEAAIWREERNERSRR